MRRRWPTRALLGAAIVVAVGAGGTALAMASEPGPASGRGPAQASVDHDPFLRCLKANGAQVRTETSADGRRSVKVTGRSKAGSPDPGEKCRPYAPGAGRPALKALTSAQARTVATCLRGAGVPYPAPGTKVMGVQPGTGPAKAGTRVGSSTGGAPGSGGGRTVSGGAASPGVGTSPAPAGGGKALDPKTVGALGKCARAAGLPSLALVTGSGHGPMTDVVVAGTARRAA